ncbi:STAS domain-containing protein [Niveispirillum sp. KHB5.9]|uniref:STAS domain-containing protein n=1 Tax=Niveispirillum sp. KHB5.9 TaxID=3400269 RepID=UPI003A8728A9
MMIELRHAGSVPVVTVSVPRIDAAVAVRFRQQFLEMVPSGADGIVIDISPVVFIDSSGLGALISIIKALGLKQRPSICGLQKSVQTMFSLTRMDKVFAIHPDVDSAIPNLG